LAKYRKISQLSTTIQAVHSLIIRGRSVRPELNRLSTHKNPKGKLTQGKRRRVAVRSRTRRIIQMRRRMEKVTSKRLMRQPATGQGVMADCRKMGWKSRETVIKQTVR